MTAQQPIKIDIWSDIACPWCYIGKRKLENALEEYAGASDSVPVEVEFHSFQLSPDVPEGFEGNQTEYLSKNKGMSLEQTRQMMDNVANIAKNVDLHYDMDSVKMTNTRLAHELLHYAKSQGKQAEMKERLMHAYFVEGGSVGKVDALAKLAAEVGLDENAVKEVLNNGTYTEAFHADVAQARTYGINGVPFFVFNEKYGVSGAQESATFLQVLNQVATDTGDAESAG